MRLIDADALRADYFVTSTTTNNPLYRYVSMEQIANAPTVEPASPWHRVEEEPKEEKRYLVWEANGFAYCDAWKEGKWQVASTVPGTHITHWMPIEPPKGTERSGT